MAAARCRWSRTGWRGLRATGRSWPRLCRAASPTALSTLYVDLVGITTPGALAAVLDVVPKSHLLFGTDYPFWRPQEAVDDLARLPLAAEDIAAIERGNALALMPGLGGLGRA